MSLLRPLRLLLISPPGGGKGTVSSKLLKEYQSITSISSGDLLRNEIRSKTDVGQLASKIIQEGGLLPDDIVSNIVIKELKSRNLLNNKNSWLLDGFPRTLNQAKVLHQDLFKYDSTINLVVELKVPEKVILERIENRWVHIPSGRIYNLQYNPPKITGKDDVTGEQLSKRPDDNTDVFLKRLEAYKETIGPVKEWYDQQGVLDSVEGETSDIIYPKLLELIKKKFNQ
ncbi:hypothetical protein WICMUC_001579 [Wickerhamomyces mucosus]|uniref:GTP:AMP phosphotransferase, mitochondrial n=1 Tax=Wickerhamomyces mucosus TaxID=1378264 RepID=A0A9P8TGU2_9ASCO|nr:hypothetical protein WICMUC_001579 [Wickerhamomyces mucosus]